MLKATIKRWQEGVEAYKAGNVREAQSCFQSIDDMSKILFNLGIVFCKQNNYAEAITAFNKSTKCDPYLSISYFMMGVASQNKGDTNGAVRHYDDSIQTLRGHEFIDYKQLGMDYKLLLSEILVNKAMCLSKTGGSGSVPQLMRDATNCKAVRDEAGRYRFNDLCSELSSGKLPGQAFSVPLDLLFLPPKIKTDKKGDNKPAPKPEASARPTNPLPTPGRPATVDGASTKPALPALPARRGTSSEGSGAKKSLPALPAKPTGVHVQSPQTLVTIKCFYKDRRLIQLSSSSPDCDELRDKIEAKFQVSGLQVKYKTSSGDLKAIRTVQDLKGAFADNISEIYLNLAGETNQFEPAATATKSPTSSTPPVVSPISSLKNSYTNGAKSLSSSAPTISSLPARPAKPQKTAPESPKKLWVECYTDDGDKYFYNTETGDSSWDPDIEPSPPWTVCYTETGDKYYYNPDTDASSWEFPG